MASIAEQAAFGAISRSDSNLNPPAGLVYHQPGVSTPGCQDDRANTHPCLAPELNAFELFGSIEDIFRFLSEILRTFQRFLLVRNIANVLSERYEADISWQAPCSKRLSDRGHAKRSPTLEYSQNSSSAPCLTSCLHSPLYPCKSPGVIAGGDVGFLIVNITHSRFGCTTPYLFTCPQYKE